MTLAGQVLVGLLAGLATGLFFGESAAPLAHVGRMFVLLLQMTVIPFVAVALITGIGGLSPARARALVRHAGGFLLAVWVVTLMVVVAAPLAFPNWKAASFFSTSLVKEREAFDILSLYIPSNPFRSFADGIVPAVVVFSAGFGIALMGSSRKQGLLTTFLAAQDALRTLTRAIIRLAPVGVFAITAAASGTLPVESLRGLQVYAVVYSVLALVVGFWVLPSMVSAVTPLRYREVVGPVRDALVTAFATGSVFVVLPILSERCKDLMTSRGADEEAASLVDVVVPISFTLVGAGNLLSLVFVMFAGWLSGFPIGAGELPKFLGTGIFAFFANATVAIPFLLDLFHIPTDTFQLYLVADSIVGDRFRALTSSMHTVCLALVAACGAAGWDRLRLRSSLVALLGTVLLVGGALAGVRFAFEQVTNPYEGYAKFIQRGFLLPTVPWSDRDEIPPTVAASGGDVLTQIAARGSLRVGYAANRLPYGFRNEAGELVGFDIEMAHALARDLGVRVEFFRIDLDRLVSLLDAGMVDVVMSGIAITPERLQQAAMTEPYLEETFAFIVRDHEREGFRSTRDLQKRQGLRLAVPVGRYYAAKALETVPNAVVSTVESPRTFFIAGEGVFDALVFSAEAGSAWTLIYPQYTVAVPRPGLLRIPIGYAVARREQRFRSFLDSWIMLKRRDRTMERLFAYWFEGKAPAARERRWSVLHDVLAWDDEDDPPAEPEPAS